MTSDAQSALRRVMETYSKVTRFCLICNYVTRIIEPLASRCAKFRFKPLPVDSMSARLAHIAATEGVVINSDTMDALMASSKGDMRKAVTYLQSAHQLSMGGAVLSSLIYEISGQVPPAILQRLWSAFQATSFDNMASAVSEILLDGYPTSSILLGLQELIINMGSTGSGGGGATSMDHSSSKSSGASGGGGGASDSTQSALPDITKALICEKIAQVI